MLAGTAGCRGALLAAHTGIALAFGHACGSYAKAFGLADSWRQWQIVQGPDWRLGGQYGACWPAQPAVGGAIGLPYGYGAGCWQ